MALFLGFFSSISSAANEENSSQSRLRILINKITNVRQLLTHHQNQKMGLQKELRETELAINAISLKLNQSTEELERKVKAIQKLLVQQTKYQQQIKQKQVLLLQQIKTGYLLGLNKNQTEILLQTAGVENVNRLLIYNRYLTQHTHDIIADLEKDLALLQDTRNLVQKETDQLKTLTQSQMTQQRKLDVHKQNQTIVLQNLTSQVKNHSIELEMLLKNKENLEKIIQNLHKKTPYSSDYLTHHKGKFDWPVRGKLLEHFGSRIGQSELKQNGVIISAAEGQKVQAVAPGKVIFANWMPGYGLLLIIDHGKGYMTLYGNNTVLYKKTADLVAPHELIAKVGHTGGTLTTGLYFALRYQGKSVDPAVWCGAASSRVQR